MRVERKIESGGAGTRRQSKDLSSNVELGIRLGARFAFRLILAFPRASRRKLFALLVDRLEILARCHNPDQAPIP